MHQQNEAELIAQSLDGNHEAYGELVDRYKNAMFHHCFAIVKNEDVAEDIAQETFITAYYKLHTYKPAFRLSTWLFKIATNKSLNWLARARREVLASDELFAAIPSSLPTPDVLVRYSELDRAIEGLQARERAIVRLYYWRGLRYDQIAKALNEPVGSVKAWMYRAKEALRKELS